MRPRGRYVGGGRVEEKQFGEGGLPGRIMCVSISGFIYPCQKDILTFRPKERFSIWNCKPHRKFRKNRDRQTLRNRKLRSKPHLRGTKTANRTWNRISKRLKPQPANTTPHYVVTGSDRNFASGGASGQRKIWQLSDTGSQDNFHLIL